MTETPTEYGALVSEMLRRAAVNRQPAHGAFELTSRCNLRCRMCYVRQAAGDMTKAAKELPASAWLELARQAVDNGTVFLLLTGGEVLLRRDFFEIYEPLTRMGLVLALFTNGTLITKDIASRLAQAPPSRTEITLYGATTATYEAVTGTPNSFAACCSGIEALVSHRIPLGLKTTITRQNVGELEAMRQMAHNWGVPFSASWLLAKRPDRTASDVEDCRLSAIRMCHARSDRQCFSQRSDRGRAQGNGRRGQSQQFLLPGRQGRICHQSGRRDERMSGAEPAGSSGPWRPAFPRRGSRCSNTLTPRLRSHPSVAPVTCSGTVGDARRGQ